LQAGVVPRRNRLMSEPQQIHIARQTVQLGVFSVEEIAAGLANGRFLPADLAWTNGMAAWKPLGEWPVFAAAAAAGVPPSPFAVEPITASLIPWEQGKSLGSFFATVKAATLSPRETFAAGRFGFSDWLAFCYLALALTLPLQFFALFAFGSKNQQIAALMSKLGLAEVAQKMLASPEPPLWATAIGMVIGVGLAPLVYALTGVFQSLGMKLFRMTSTLERTVSATLLATSVLILLAAPLQLLGFSFLLQMGVGFLAFVPLSIVYFRVLGVATGTSPWAQFGITCLVFFVLCCCCCVVPVLLAGGLGAVAAAAH